LAIESRDKETMKVIHDVKNPLIAASQIIENSSLNEDQKNNLNFEFDCIKEMLDALRIEFKSKYDMQVQEESK